jgi:hypothetical protein
MSWVKCRGFPSERAGDISVRFNGFYGWTGSGKRAFDELRKPKIAIRGLLQSINDIRI